MLQAEGREVHALSIDYGQRHRLELDRAAEIAALLRLASHTVLSADLRAVGGSALTDAIAVPKAEDPGECVEPDIPSTYVPARNTIFLALALGFAEARGICHIAIGVNALDYSGYPDCRPDFIAAFEKMANLATKVGVEGGVVRVLAPLLSMSKQEILEKAAELNVPVERALSCYDPADDGTPCGLCDSCRLRIQAAASLASRADE